MAEAFRTGHEFESSGDPLSLEGMWAIAHDWDAHGSGMAVDPRVRAFGTAMDYMIPDNAELQEVLLNFVNYQNDPLIWQQKPEPHDQTSYQGINHFLRSIHHIAMFLETAPIEQKGSLEILVEKGLLNELPNVNKYKFPKDFHRPEAWEELVNYILGNPHLVEMLNWDLNHRHVQTNVVGRYKGVHIAVNALNEQIYGDRPKRWLDIGPSIGLGPLAELSGHKHSFVNAHRRVPVLGTDEYEHYMDPILSSNIERNLKRKTNYEKVVGADLAQFNTWLDVLWVRSSYYTSELMRKEVVGVFDKLRKIEDSRYVLLLANFAIAQSVKEFSETENAKDKFHVVSALTVTNQLSEENAKSFNQNAISQLTENGAYIRQDFKYKDWTVPYSYSTEITIPSIAENPVEIICWENGRCENMVVPTGVDLNDIVGTVRRLGN